MEDNSKGKTRGEIQVFFTQFHNPIGYNQSLFIGEANGKGIKKNELTDLSIQRRCAISSISTIRGRNTSFIGYGSVHMVFAPSLQGLRPESSHNLIFNHAKLFVSTV